MSTLIITCEHGGNRVPAPYRHLFRGCAALLDSHRGYDPGALVMARALAGRFSAPLLSATVSRLLVDLNRSVGHRNLHMQAIGELPGPVREEIIAHHYQPYRREVERLVTQGTASGGRVIHISCHSFTPELDGVVREVDIGLLYDPARPGERALCARWKSALQRYAPGLVIRRNFPYRGRGDGLTTTLRKAFPSDAYTGIELELSQQHVAAPPRQWSDLRESIILSLEAALGDHGP